MHTGQLFGFGLATYEWLVSARAGRELRRPWKLATLAGGMAWLLYGALAHDFADWDVGISLLMGGLTFLCAPWTLRALWFCLRDRPPH